jgi:hypothetical protein
LESRLAPSISAIEGSPFSGVVASVTDPDPSASLSAFTASINWGDGSPASAGTITQPGGAGTNLVVSGSHTYADEGNFQATVTVTEGSSSALDFSNGFAGSTNLLTYNGSATIVGTFAQLTDPSRNGVGTFFSTNQATVSTFMTQFSFQLLNPNADGFTFCIQGNSPTALGPSGGGLGYGPDHVGGTGGIANSIAVKFDLFSNQGEGPDSTGLYTNGAAPTIPAINLTGTGIDLHSQDVFNVTMAYDGTTLNVTITDAKTGASASQSYTINIPATVGGKTAYVGFTGSFGLATATQNILTWNYGAALATTPAIVSDADVLHAVGGFSFTAVEGGAPISGTVATFTDAYLQATVGDLVATINWGDGITSTGTITGAAGNFTVTASHTFVDEGPLPVTVTITDDGAGTAMAVAQDSATVSETDALTAVTLSSSLVSLWKAEGNANDSAGTNNGTLQSGATFAPGKFGQAFSFDGVNAYVQAGTTGLPTSNGDRTMAFWVNINAFDSGETWFAGYGNFGTNNQVYSMGASTTSHTLFFSSWGPGISGPALQTGTWYYVAATNVVNSVTLYLNGVSVATGNLPMNTPAGTNFYMGRIPGSLGDSRKLNGLIDEVAVFNRALSPAEIQAAMNDNFTGFANNPAFKASEGQPFSGTVAAFKDANTNAVLSDFAVTINWGDGTTGPGSVKGSAGNYIVVGNHTYAESGSYTYSVQIADDPPSNSALSISGGTAIVADSPLTFFANSPISSVEGQPVTGLLGSFTDSNALATPADFTATVDWGDGSTSPGTIVPHIGPVPALSVGANVNMSMEPGNQNECSLAINPTNHNNVVAWSNDENTIAGGVDEYKSLDGGNTWTRKLIGANDGLEVSACCDTQSVFDSFGNLFAVNIDFASGFSDSIKVLESFDGGTTFQVVTITTDPNGGLDQPSIAFGDGMVWVSYKDNSGGAIMAAGAAVTGLGKVGSFSTPEAASGSVDGSFGGMAVSSPGQVMVTYQSPVASSGPSTIFVNVDPDGLGPKGFGPAITVSPTNVGGFDPIPPQPSRTVDAEANVYYDNSGGPHTGRAYLVYTDAPSLGSSATDIFVRISDDNGMTWTNPVRITDDTSGKSHFNPQMAIDQTTGNVAVAWFDSRNSGANDQTAQIFATVSTDGGVTWMPNIQVSAGTSNVTLANSFIDYGDYMLMDFYGGTFRPIWSDNSNSTGDNPDGTLSSLDIYTAPVTLTQGVGFDVMGTHTYTEEGSFTAKVQVTDTGGSTAMTTTKAHVVDAPLTPLATQASATEQTGFTGRVASFTDNDSFATTNDFTATITWGDGHKSAGTVTANANGGFDVTGVNTYGEEGTYSISVAIQDVGGSKITIKSTAVVMDASLTPSGLSLTTMEGTAISGQFGMFLDGFANAPLTDFTTAAGGATINWGDGSRPSVGIVTQPGGVGSAFAVTGSHLYSDAGSYSVLVTLHDKGGSSAMAITTVTVTDAPLTTIGIAFQLVEGTPFSGQVAAFIDANPLAPLATFTTGKGSVTINWGDGSPVSLAAVTQPGGRGSAFVVSGSHTYTDERSYTIQVVATDRGGATAQSLAPALVLDAGLMASGVAVNAFENTPFTGMVATFVDANSFATFADFSTGIGYARIDWGDGFASLGTVTQPGGQGTPFVITGAHLYSQIGTYTVQVNIYDIGGSQAAASSTATVLDAPLTLTTGPLTMTEGAAFSGKVASFTDASTAAPLTDFTTGTGGATIDWGDGSMPTSATITQPLGVGTAFVISGSHLYQEDGTYSVKVSVRDRAGSQTQSSFNSTVLDAALSAAGAPAKQFDGFTYTGTLATVTDTNPAAPLTDFTTGTGGATIDWGDGSPTVAGMVTQPGGVGTSFVVQGTHTYTKLGTYTIQVTIQDVGGSAGSASTSLTLVHFDDLIGRVAKTGQWTVAVSNGTNAFTFLPYGTWDPTKTWVDVQVGDFNGDGRPDVAGRDLASGDWWVSLSNGTSFTTSDWGHWSPAVTWVDVKVGDFTGNGKTDIVGRWAQSGQWWMAQSTGSSFVNSLWGSWSANPLVTWTDVQVGDFNGDGKADLTGRWLQGGSWWTAVSTGSSFITNQWGQWSPNVTWVDVKVGDFTGDGKADLVGRWAQTGQWWVATSTGSSFTNSLWATWSTAVTWTDVKVGDFNGDGKADIIGRVAGTGSWWAGLSTGANFQTTFWTSWPAGLTWTNVQVGDFNGDGKTDLVGFALETSTWWTSLSTGTSGVTSPWAVWSQPNVWVDVHVADFG